MSFVRFMAAQLRRPSGWFGSMVLGPVMNRVSGRIMETAIALLQIEPQHQVLEIGFGGGCALAMLARRISSVVVSGVDLSPDMVRRAERRFRKEVTAGRMRLQCGDVSRLPYPDQSFDRVLTINTIYFWPDTLQGLGEIRRVLKPDGRAAVGIRSREKMDKHGLAQHGFRLFSADELAVAMREAGFRDVSLDERDQEKFYDQVIALGTR